MRMHYAMPARNAATTGTRVRAPVFRPEGLRIQSRSLKLTQRQNDEIVYFPYAVQSSKEDTIVPPSTRKSYEEKREIASESSSTVPSPIFHELLRRRISLVDALKSCSLKCLLLSGLLNILARVAAILQSSMGKAGQRPFTLLALSPS